MRYKFKKEVIEDYIKNGSFTKYIDSFLFCSMAFAKHYKDKVLPKHSISNEFNEYLKKSEAVDKNHKNYAYFECDKKLCINKYVAIKKDVLQLVFDDDEIDRLLEETEF